VIEIGPGTGNLTRHLLATNAHVLAVEKDDVLVERLRDELKQVCVSFTGIRLGAVMLILQC
jgi:16S rRNA A1518/A1519 N6-dimethyltransferase RsmA/KsgA/DIM1 with predicted DNA glycosylase/AP lyase activity